MKHLTNTQPTHLLYLCRQSKNNTKDKHAHAKWTPKWQNFQAKKNVFLLLLFLTKTVLSLIHIHRFSLSALITLSYRISITTKLQTSLYISLHFNINTVTYSHTHTFSHFPPFCWQSQKKSCSLSKYNVHRSERVPSAAGTFIYCLSFNHSML